MTLTGAVLAVAALPYLTRLAEIAAANAKDKRRNQAKGEQR